MISLKEEKKPKIIKVFILERQQLNTDDSDSPRTTLDHTLKGQRLGDTSSHKPA